MKILQKKNDLFIGPLEIKYTEDTKRFIITSLVDNPDEYFTLWRHPETVKSKLEEGLSSGDKVITRRFWISGSIKDKNKPIRNFELIKTPQVELTYKLWEEDKVLSETKDWNYSLEVEKADFSMKVEGDEIFDLKSLVLNQLVYLLNYHKEIS